MDFLSKHKIIIVIAALIVAGGIWFWLSGSSSSSPQILTTQTPATASAGDQQLVATLLALRAVTLNGGIFSEPSFLSLKDFTTQIIPEPVGRDNPFAPLTTKGIQSASSTRAASLFTPRR
jgi:hypothetical protein